MPLFRRKRDEQPVDMNERSPELGVRYRDLAVLDQLVRSGANLTESRQVVYYAYAPTERAAHAMRDEAVDKGFAVEVREPLTELPAQWALVFETHAVTSPDFVVTSDDFFEELAERHGGQFDGWEASV